MPNSVSVVIPYSDAYTRREKLNEAIASVESQTPTTEIIVRTDDGVATARNAGIEEASNRYIALPPLN